MNLLTGPLPESVTVCGAKRPIDPDFRLMVRLESAVTAADGLEADTLADLLFLFYRGNLLPDAEAAVDGMLWFYRCGKEAEEKGGAASAARVYDFEQDAQALYASFLQAYGMDLSVDTVHWWQFRQLMFALPQDTPFAQRLHYRTADTSSMGKEQKRHYAKMKRLYAVKDCAKGRETLVQRDARMLAYVHRRFSEVSDGPA